MAQLLSDKYAAWKAECEARFLQLKQNEEELNRIFIDIYGLQDELTPDVADRDVTVHRVYDSRDDIPESMRTSNYVRTMRDEIVSLISYAVGCMFGRYSLDVEGLVYAGGEWGDAWAEIEDSGQWSVGSGQLSGDSGQWLGNSEQWAVGSGQGALSGGRKRLFSRRLVEYYVGKELSRACGMAEVYVADGGDLSLSEISPERGAILAFGSNAEGGGFDSVQYCRGTSKKLHEGICQLSVDSKGFDGGTVYPTYDLCSPEILDAIASGNCAELMRRGFQDADKVDWKSIRCSLITNHFDVDNDNIIPICDDEYFDDDIVGRFVKFVEVVYGAETLEQNLKFIADALGGKGTPREVIRSYFLNDFYADHVKTYQKRPIYWQFSSGKKNGFKALIYMHRYALDLLARMRTDYVHELQERYRTQLHLLDNVVAATAAEQVKTDKRKAKIREQEAELAVYEEKIHHLADQMIAIDLDDGVKVNYAKFADVLEKIK